MESKAVAAIKNSVEILISALVVGTLLWIAFYVQPKVETERVLPSPFGYRNYYFGVVAPAADGNVIWAVGYDGRIIRSDDGGSTWRIQNTPTTSHLQDIAAWDPQSALVVGDKGTVLITADAGESWSQVDIVTRQFGDQLLQAYVSPNSDKAWITGTFGTVLFSDDRGRNWHKTYRDEDIAWNDITMDPRGRLWLAGEFGRLSRSADDGRTWQEVDVGTGMSLMAVTFADRDHGVAVGLSGTIVATSNGGRDWELEDSGTDAHLFDVIWDGASYIAVGDGGTIVEGAPDASSWEPRQLSPNEFGWYTKIVDTRAGYYVTGSSIGIFRDGRWRPFTEHSASGT